MERKCLKENGVFDSFPTLLCAGYSVKFKMR